MWRYDHILEGAIGCHPERVASQGRRRRRYDPHVALHHLGRGTDEDVTSCQHENGEDAEVGCMSQPLDSFGLGCADGDWCHPVPRLSRGGVVACLPPVRLRCCLRQYPTREGALQGHAGMRKQT